MKSINNILWLLLSLIFLFLTSCTFTGIFTSTQKEYNLKRISQKDLVQELEARNSSFRNLRGDLRLKIYDETGKHQTSGEFFLTSDNNLYMELYGLVGETEMVTNLREDSFFVYNYFENVAIEDKSSEFSLDRIIGLDIDSDLFFALISGRITNFFDLRETIIKKTDDALDKKVQEVAVTLSKDFKDYILTLDTKLNLTKLVILDEGKIKYSMKLDYYFNDNGVILPKYFSFSKVSGIRKKLTLFYSSPEVNTKFMIPNYRKIN